MLRIVNFNSIKRGFDVGKRFGNDTKTDFMYYYCTKKKRFFNSIVIKCANNLLNNSISLNSFKNHPDDHRYEIVKSIFQNYIFILICKFLKERNLELKQKSLRKKVTALVRFSNQ